MKESYSTLCFQKFELVLKLNQRNEHNLFDENCKGQSLPITKKMDGNWMDE